MTGNVDLVDADLVEAARRGDAACAGALLARHRAAMHAVAVSLLGWSPDAEDAVQDAMLTALQRIGELRDASAAGPWLKAITRNNARMRLRSPDRTEPASTDLDSWPSREPSAEDLLDQHAMRDWLWSALETLSEPLHITVLLRYFTDSSSYQQIAAICGVPVGTVRSRLNEARRRLTAALVSSATALDD
jgi:RNA polymerase sigma factor (sigma-70 family)